MSQESPQRGKPGLLWRMLLPMIQWLWPRGGTSLLLTTVGRRSGQPRTVIVGHLRDGDDVIVADINIVKQPSRHGYLTCVLIQSRRFGSAGNGTKHGQSSSKEKIGRASGTGWWLPTRGTIGCSDLSPERSMSSGCAGLRGRPSSRRTVVIALVTRPSGNHMVAAAHTNGRWGHRLGERATSRSFCSAGIGHLADADRGFSPYSDGSGHRESYKWRSTHESYCLSKYGPPDVLELKEVEKLRWTPLLRQHEG